jgi:hypothetical protein
MTMQRSHHAYPGEHRRPVMLSNEKQRLHRGLPFCSIVFRLGELGDVERGVAEGDQRFPARHYDRIEKRLILRQADYDRNSA